jgi:hypothetical protein
MSDDSMTQDSANRTAGDDSRRRQLRALLLSAADTARQDRRMHRIAERVTRPVGRALRDRVSMLLSAAG